MTHIFPGPGFFSFSTHFPFLPGQGGRFGGPFLFPFFLNKKVINFVINFVIKFLINKVINFLINFLINGVINLLINSLINFLINFLMHNVNNKFFPDPGRKPCKIGKKWAKSLKNHTYKIEKGEFYFMHMTGEKDLAAGLHALLAAGIISIGEAAAMLEKADDMKKEKITKEHDRKVFQSGGYWMTYYRDAQGKQRRIKRRTKAELLDALAEILHPAAPTISQVFTEWNDARLAQGHIIGSTHLRDLKFYRQFYRDTDMAGRGIDTITPREWADWLQDRLDAGITAKAWAGLRGITRGMIKYAGKRSWIDYQAAAVFDRVEIHKNSFKRKRKEESQEIYYPEELAALRAYCTAHWDTWTSCLWLISMTGMRIGEAVALTPWDVHLETMTVRVHRTETNGDDLEGVQSIDVRDDAKTDAGTRDVSLPPSARDRLAAIRQRALDANWPWLFCRDTGERIEGRAVRKRLEKACEECGIPYRPPHKLRKTIASILIESDAVDSRTVIRQMGHVDMNITETYYHRDRKRALERAEALEQVQEIGTAQ